MSRRASPTFEVFVDEKGITAAGFLRRAVRWFKGMGIAVERVLSGNRSGAHAEACRELGMRDLFTRPYRPRTNGKTEPFIQTLTNRWAYGASAERTAALPLPANPLQLQESTRYLGHKAPGGLGSAS